MDDLIAKLEAAEAGSPELDSLIFRHFDGPLPTEFVSKKISLEWQGDGTAMMPVGDMLIRYTPPAFTTSLDAALNLAEGVLLPGSGVGLCQVSPDDWEAWIGGRPAFMPRYRTAALALCIAILKATREKSNG